MQKWGSYISGSVSRQEFLQAALDWVSHGHIKDYMQEHRREDNINELKLHFSDVISWIENTFDVYYSTMKGLKWGELYDKYHNNPYDHKDVSQKVEELISDPCVTDKKNVFEYVLGGCQDKKILMCAFLMRISNVEYIIVRQQKLKNIISATVLSVLLDMMQTKIESGR